MITKMKNSAFLRPFGSKRAWPGRCIVYCALSIVHCALLSACQNDDTDFSAYTLNGTSTTDDDDDGDNTGGGSSTVSSDTIYIAYNGTNVTVTNDQNGYVSVAGADVTVTDTDSEDAMVLVLSGTATDGSLLVSRARKYTIVLNGVNIYNSDGPAINNQCSKSLYIVCADGSENTLTDGTSYADRTWQQKGALFSEGQIYFSGSGTLNVYGNCKNAIACDDYITFDGDIVLNATASDTGSNGIKANDGVFVNGGTLTVSVSADGARGIRSEARTVITGGTTTITTSGDCEIETVDGVADTTSAACIKSDSLFTMTGGTLIMTSTGDGGKGISCDENIEVSGGTFVARTTGSNDEAKPKAVKSDTGIIVSGGSFTATVKKSWACDNGTDSETPADHLTVKGTPASQSITKKSVIITY